jgi:hypothetical protein
MFQDYIPHGNFSLLGLATEDVLEIKMWEKNPGKGITCSLQLRVDYRKKSRLNKHKIRVNFLFT